MSSQSESEKLLSDVLSHCNLDVNTPDDSIKILREKMLAEKKKHDLDENARMLFWANLFESVHIKSIGVDTDSSFYHEDDLLCFVKKAEHCIQTQANTTPERFFVKRRQNNLPAKDDATINWEETFFLNVILHHFDYTLEVSVREKTVDPETQKPKLNAITKNTKKVYPTPSKVTMTSRAKAESVEYTYPLLYFAIDDFTDAWKDITLTKGGDMICVELFATGNFFSKGFTPIRVRLFAGGLEYDTVKKNYSERTSSLWSSRSDQFFKLIGPNKKGHAEMAVSTQALQMDDGSAPQSPLSPTALMNSFNKFGSALKRATWGPTTTPEHANPRLNCWVTYLNIKWDLIVKDILQFSIKAQEDSPSTQNNNNTAQDTQNNTQSSPVT
mmetsp:Transcript_18470/g.25892  ORF Transcript_18470/g.25892 Transcript_18470/m.25892 type:complete len:385 (-) Transcript_18470:15-1169(-)